MPKANERDCSFRRWVKIAGKRIRESDHRCFFKRWHFTKRSRSRPMHAADHFLTKVRLQRLRNRSQPRRDLKGATERQAERPVSHAMLVLGLAVEDRLKRRNCIRASLQELLLGGHHRPRAGEVSDKCEEGRSRHARTLPWSVGRPQLDPRCGLSHRGTDRGTLIFQVLFCPCRSTTWKRPGGTKRRPEAPSQRAAKRVARVPAP